MDKEKLNKIVLIGNGFDLSHGLKTSYKDFIKWYLKESVESALSNNSYEYIDDCLRIIVTEKIHSIVSADDVREELSNQFDTKSLNINYVNNYVPNNTGQLVRLETNSLFVYRILNDCLNSDWHGIENEIYIFLAIKHHQLKMHFNDNNLPVNSTHHKFYKETTSQVNSLNSSVKHLKNKLIEYLRTQNKPTKNKLNLFDHVLADASPDTDCLFLNFNYTNYFYHDFSILTQRFKTPKINKLNIHGSLNSEIDDVVFGIGDEHDDLYNEVESRYGNEWLECMKSFHYLRNESYQELLGFTETPKYEIYVMGHSCAITDRTLLNMLFENERCKKIHVFHHKGMESYLNTSYNIARNFKDKVKLREVLQPYNPALKM